MKVGRAIEGLIVVIIAIAVSSPLLLMLEHPLKYALYVFGLSLIVLLLTMYALEYDLRLNLNMHVPAKIVDSCFVLCSFALFLSNVFVNSLPNVSFILSIIVIFFLPGWVLLRLLGVSWGRISYVEFFTLPFLLSLGLTPLIFTFVLQLPTHRDMLLSAIYMSISLLPLLKTRFSKFNEKTENSRRLPMNEHPLFNVLLLAWISLFFIFVISSLYPNMVYMPCDIVRLFSSSQKLLLTLDVHVTTAEPGFLLSWAATYDLSSPSMEVFQTGFAYLSLISIFSFYVMSKAYLGDLDKRAPILATIFWAVFSGFGWLYFLQQKIAIPDPGKQVDLLVTSNDVSYFDIGYGQGPWLWLWFRPLTLGLTIFFVLTYLMKREDLTTRNFMILFSLSTLSLGLIHFSEMVVFVVFTFALALICPTIRLRLKEATLSILISLVALLLLMIAHQYLHGPIMFSYQHILLLGVLAVVSYLFLQFPRRFSVRFGSVSTYFVLMALLIYSTLLLYWFLNADSFSVGRVIEIGAVPWELYPVLLGVCGLLAFSGITIISKQFRDHPIVIFPILFVASIAFGRILTYLNANFMETGYWERRIIPFLYVASSVMAALVLSKVMKQLRNKRVLSFILLSFVAISGIASTFLSIELRQYAQKGNLTNEDVESINLLKSVDPRSVLLTVTERSKLVAEYVPFAILVDSFRHHIWPAENPEFPMSILSCYNSSTFIYLHERDKSEIAKTYGDGYLASHVLPLAPELYESPKVNVFQVPKLAPPSQESDMILVLPESCNSLSWYGYDVLSLGYYNFTTAPISDIKTISQGRILITPTEDLALKLVEYKDKYKMNFEKLIVLNIDGYGKIAEEIFDGPKMEISLNSVSLDNAYLQLVQPYSSDPNVNITRLATFTGFRVVNNLSEMRPLVISDEYSSNQWIAKGLGFGSIGITELADNATLKVSGNNSLEIKVSEGKYGSWLISRVFPDPLNLESYDFITFYWHGRGDGKWYGLECTSDMAKGKKFGYRFQDSWVGWKKVVLPMRIPDGTWTLYNTVFTKDTFEDPSWSKIQEIDVLLSYLNLNVTGDFYIDRLAFDLRMPIYATIKIEGTPESVEILNWNGKNYTLIAKIAQDSERECEIRNYTLADGLSSNLFFNDTRIGLISVINKTDYSLLELSIWMPPHVESEDSSQVIFGLKPSYAGVESSSIISCYDRVELPAMLNLDPLTRALSLPSSHIVAQYKGGVPFAVLVTCSNYNMTYLNVYPIIQKITFGDENSRNIYPLLRQLLKLVDRTLPLYKHLGVRQLDEVTKDVAAFQEAKFLGNLTILSPSAIFLNNDIQDLTVIVDGKKIVLWNTSKIAPISVGNIQIKTDEAKVAGGYGFYVNMTFNAAHVSFHGDILTLLVFSGDGESQSIVTGSNIQIALTNSHVLIRQPSILAQGEATFKNFYAYHVPSIAAAGSYNRVLGQDFLIKGKSFLTIQYGDKHLIANNLEFKGQFEGVSPLYQYDELKSLREILPYLLITAIIIVSFKIWPKHLNRNKDLNRNKR